MKTVHRASIAAPFALLLVASVDAGFGAGQQRVPFERGIPVAPQGLAGRRLPDTPLEFDTAEGQRIRVMAVTRALEYPWSLALSSGRRHARHRAGGSPADHSQRRPGSTTDRGPARVALKFEPR